MFKAMLLAARPKTLPAAMAPVVAGSALAWRISGEFSVLLAWCTLLSTVAIQVATNYFNDAVDARKGADTEARVGPLRATAAGLVSARAMLTAGAVMLGIAVMLSLPMVQARGWPVVVIGVMSLFFTYGYTGGPVPLAYRGLGDLFVLLFFGLIAVSGTVFVQTGEWRKEGLLLGAQIGMLSTVLIAINNLRDREEDARSNKRTLAVRFGVRFARVEIAALCLGPYLLGWWGWGRFRQSEAFLWPLAVSWLGLLIAVLVAKTPPGRKYNRFLGMSAAHLMLWTVLFTSAILWGGR